MVAVGLRMLQVFFDGPYKCPREMMWIVGVVLLALMLAFGFTGYLLPWDQSSYWATQVGIEQQLNDLTNYMLSLKSGSSS